jgi:hypothetical protein
MVMEAIHSLSIVERLQLADSRLKLLHCRGFEGTRTLDACGFLYAIAMQFLFKGTLKVA